MLLQESRRAARTSGDGNLILLEQRNLAPVRGCRGGTLGVNGRNVRLQSVGTEAARSKSTFGKRDAFGDLVPVPQRPILLLPPVASDSAIPVVELNRAVAIAMCEGLEQGLCLIDDLLAGEHLSHYHLAHSARADLSQIRADSGGPCLV